MVKLGKELFNGKKSETIMVMGTSIIFDSLFKELKENGTKFTVIIVDTSP